MHRPRPITQETANRPVLAHGRPFDWRAVDIVTLAVLGVALGVAFWGFDNLVYPVLNGLTMGFPPAGQLMLGVWLLPAVVGALIVRRPGAALLCELVASNVELLLGQKWGVAVLVSGLLQGFGVEAVAALLRWRRFGALLAVAGGAVAAVVETVAYEWWWYVPEYSLAWKLIYLACGVVSGMVIAGWGGMRLVGALASTGALDAFPPGIERLDLSADPGSDCYPVR